MPRKARFTVPEAIYHIILRGNNKAKIFLEGDDYQYFLKLLYDNKGKYQLKIYHYALLNNHVHIIVWAPEGRDLSESIKRTAVIYTGYFRKKYGGIGHFFQDRFKSHIIQDGIYLLECGRYIELNPVRAGVVKSPEEYKWSSYLFYAEGRKDILLDFSPEYVNLSDNVEQRKRLYQDYVKSVREERRSEERYFRMGIYGSKEYIEGLMQKGLKLKWSHSGKPKKKKRAQDV